MDDIRWHLEEIYPDQEHWERDFTGAQQQLAAFERYRGRLGDGGATLLEALQARDRLRETGARIYNYASMKFDQDTTGPVAQGLRDRAMSLETEAAAAISFMAPELLALPEATIVSFLNSEPGLAVYRFEIDDLLRYRPHTLSPAEEEIVARAGEVIQAPNQIFKMIDNADLTFDPIRGEDGQEQPVTRGNYSVLMQSGDRLVRQETFASLYGSYRKLSNTLAATLTAGVKRDLYLARVHHHRSALEAALHEENVTEAVYSNLIGAVRSRLDLLHRYVELRRRALKVESLHMYDLYAPLVPDVKWPVNYPEAVEMVQEGLAPLGAAYVEALSRGLQAGWVDVPERPGKAGGAYCEGVYHVHPYVLLNYHQNIDNAFTLAHEMGHAMHFYYSDHRQPFIYAMPTIFTAEVASTTNETLLMEHLLHTVSDRERRLYLLNHYLELFRGTIFRQTMFAEFEQIIHAKAESGEALTNSYLQQTYRQLNLDYHGSAMTVDQEIDLEWARIPHFYNAFYVYKYATGLSAAVALARGILQHGRPALDRYLDFLSRGSSDYSLNLLRLAGVEMSRPDPVNQALERFGQLLEEMERSL
ncbi:MAG: oligoendopeptidase F [Thermacetogeniaceae bacterium]